jgi:8-oxo-dGTP pyrophosphatase MutT (NUDIX family)
VGISGGKTRAGEDHEECILREIDEELGMDIVICGRLDDVVHDYGDKTDQAHTLHLRYPLVKAGAAGA